MYRHLCTSPQIHVGHSKVPFLLHFTSLVMFFYNTSSPCFTSVALLFIFFGMWRLLHFIFTELIHTSLHFTSLLILFFFQQFLASFNFCWCICCWLSTSLYTSLPRNTLTATLYSSTPSKTLMQHFFFPCPTRVVKCIAGYRHLFTSTKHCNSFLSPDKTSCKTCFLSWPTLRLLCCHTYRWLSILIHFSSTKHTLQTFFPSLP